MANLNDKDELKLFKQKLNKQYVAKKPSIKQQQETQSNAFNTLQSAAKMIADSGDYTKTSTQRIADSSSLKPIQRAAEEFLPNLKTSTSSTAKSLSQLAMQSEAMKNTVPQQQVGRTDIADQLQNIAKNSASQKTLLNPNETYEQSIRRNAQKQLDNQLAMNEKYGQFNGADKLAYELASGVSQQIPFVAGSLVNPALGIAALSNQVFGQSVNSALNDGANLPEAQSYGLGETGKELATSLMFGGMAKTPGIKNVYDIVEKAGSKNALARLGGVMTGEAIEEGASEALEGAVQRATYNPNAENSSLGEIGHAALLGGLTAGVMHAPFTAIETANYIKNASIGTQNNTTPSVTHEDSLQQEKNDSATTNTTNVGKEPRIENNESVFEQNQQKEELTNNVSENINLNDFNDANLDNINSQTKQLWNLVQKRSQRMGLNIRIVDGLGDGTEGLYDGNGNILIDAKSMDNPKVFGKVVAHEVYHALKGTDQHLAIYERAKQHLVGDGKKYATEQDMLADMYDKYYQLSDGRIELDENSAPDEVGAAFIEEVLTDEQLQKQLWRDDSTLMKRIMNHIEDFLREMQNLVTMSKEERTQYNEMRKVYESMQRGMRELEYNGGVIENTDVRHAIKNIPKETQEENLASFMRGSLVVNEDGTPKVVYSGHGNTNLFGDRFNIKNATSGGFYFTEDADIASNYAKDKMGNLEQWSNGSEYRFKNEKGQYKNKISDIRLTDEQADIFDEWFMENLGWTFNDFINERSRYDANYRRMKYTGGKRSLSNIFYLMNENGYTLPSVNYGPNGNTYAKSQFEELMDDMGIEWDSYLSNRGGVFPVYLSIKNPIDTSQKIPDELMDAFRNAANKEKRKQTDMEEFELHWTKDYPMRKWVEDIDRMQETGEETYWATQIPTKARKIMLELGYDGIKDVGGKMGGAGHTVWIALEPNQVKSAIGNKGTYDASKSSIRMSLEDNKQNAINQNGTIPKGENPFRNNREIDVAQSIDGVKNVSRFVRTAMEAQQVDKQTADIIEEDLYGDLSTGQYEYTPSSNQSALENAEARMRATSIDDMVDWFNGIFKGNQRINKNDVATAEMLILKLQQEQRYAEAAEVIGKLGIMGSEWGQNVQALSMLKRLTPAGKMLQMQRALNRVNEKRIQMGEESVDFPPEITENILGSKSKEMQDQAMLEAVKFVADKTEGTWADKINAIRYAAMLSNPKTHLRNILGNCVMQSVMAVKNIPQTGLETVYNSIQRARGKNGIEQSRAFANKSKNTNKELYAFASDYFNETASAMLSGSKYSNSSNAQEIRNRVFKNDLLEKATKSVGDALEWEDVQFKRFAFKNALVAYMKANGIGIEDARRNTQQFQRAVQYSINEAKKATFTEDNKGAELIKDIANTNAATQLIVGGLIPFTRTPMNIAVRGFEYSPAGLSMTLWKAFDGKHNARDVIESLSANLTGTALCALGYTLASMGRLEANDDNDKKDKYEKQMGAQNYSIVFDDGSTATIDWLSPSVMPLMMGAELYNEQTSDGNVDLSDVSRFADAIVRIADPLFEMSCMQGVTNALQSYSNSSGEVVSNVGKSIVSSYAGQFVPAIVGAAARTVDDTVRSTYTPKDATFGKSLESFVKQQKNKIPFASMSNYASVDVWGRDRMREFDDNIGLRFVNNFINPSSYSSGKKTGVDMELDRLYEKTGDKSIIPSYMASSYSFGGKNYYCTESEYNRISTMYGQAKYKEVQSFMQSDEYKNMDAGSRASVIADIYQLENYRAKKMVLTNHGVKASAIAENNKDKEKALSSGVPIWKYYATKQSFGGKFSDYDDAKKYIDATNKMNMSEDKFVQAYDGMKEFSGTGKKKKQEAYLRNLVKSGQITKEQYWYMYMTFTGQQSKDDKSRCPYQWMITE